jgi:hypothetical protein
VLDCTGGLTPRRSPRDPMSKLGLPRTWLPAPGR